MPHGRFTLPYGYNHMTICTPCRAGNVYNHNPPALYPIDMTHAPTCGEVSETLLFKYRFNRGGVPRIDDIWMPILTILEAESSCMYKAWCRGSVGSHRMFSVHLVQNTTRFSLLIGQNRHSHHYLGEHPPMITILRCPGGGFAYHMSIRDGRSWNA